jgi:hypothetical protein
MQVVPRGVNRRVDRETRGVHAEQCGLGLRALVDDLALMIDLHQIRSAHLVEQDTIAIDQEGG